MLAGQPSRAGCTDRAHARAFRNADRVCRAGVRAAAGGDRRADRQSRDRAAGVARRSSVAPRLRRRIRPSARCGDSRDARCTPRGPPARPRARCCRTAISFTPAVGPSSPHTSSRGPDESLPSLQAPDTEWTDVGIVAMLSLSQAVLRVLLVHLLVPRYLAPQRLEALVRCKSVHLLSSAYPKSLTPQSSRRTLPLDEFPIPQELFIDDAPGPSEKESVLSTGATNLGQALNRCDYSDGIFPESISLFLTHSDFHNSYSAWSTCRRSARRVLGLETKAPYDSEELQDTDRLFTAPRYATAVFRLLYCIGSCTCAMVWLRDANFFPPAVGGSGSTKNCWDLKGGVALETDSDFDHRNAVLKMFFLVQASYHLHSWAIHWMSLLALWWYGKSFVSIRKSMKSYWRALLQHLMALAMIGSCYLFSSLRRLGAIGIFALDISSLFVHLLQLCINAPPESWLNRPGVIRWIHRGLVIPIFL